MLIEEDQPIDLDIETVQYSPMAAALAQAAAEEQEAEEPDRFSSYYIDSDEVVVEKERPSNAPVEESIMSKRSEWIRRIVPFRDEFNA